MRRARFCVGILFEFLGAAMITQAALDIENASLPFIALGLCLVLAGAAAAIIKD